MIAKDSLKVRVGRLELCELTAGFAARLRAAVKGFSGTGWELMVSGPW
jgi:hypothetical protein